jgi:hypothetical protein
VLISRIGTVRVNEDGTFLDDTSEVDMGQIVNHQYVCDAINAKWETTYVPVSGTASQAANCEYLLKLIDKANANRGATSYGTSSYATKQALDKAAVDTAVQSLWKPAGKFVAISHGKEAAYSTDGITWAATTMPSGANWYNVTYGNGKFVAISYFNDNTAYSTDGITWKAGTMPSNANWHSVTYGNGKFVATALHGEVAYSTDGITWKAATMPSHANWHRATYGNGKFVAISPNEGKAAYSTDGITWAAATMPSHANWHRATYGGE